eukprot:jgi/Chlat1/2482/Chrsp175S00137
MAEAILARLKQAVDGNGADDGDTESGRKRRRSRGLSFQPLVQQLVYELEDIGLSSGLPPQALHAAVDVATVDAVDSKTALTLLGACLPSTVVWPKTVVLACGALGGAPVVVKVAIIKWIILIHNCIESHSILQALYPQLFQLLDYQTVRPYTCHLLYKLTQRRDVQPFRIRKLQALIVSSGREPWIAALLARYQQLCPELPIVASAAQSSSTPFKPLDACNPGSGLVEALANMQARSPSAIIDRSATEVKTVLSRGRHTAETAVTVPSVQTAISNGHWHGQPVLEDMQSFQEFCEHVDTLALPQQLAAVINDTNLQNAPPLQHLFLMRAEQSAIQRVREWVQFALEEPLAAANESRIADDVLDILRKLVRFCQFYQELLPEIEQYLVRFSATWNGRRHRTMILQLYRQLRPCAWEDLYQDVLLPLQKLCLDGSAELQAAVIDALTEMLRSWLRYDWKQVAVVSLPGGAAALEATAPFEVWLHHHHIFGAIPGGVNYYTLLQEVIHYVDSLGSHALGSTNAELVVLDSMLNFYEVVSVIASKHSVPFTRIPSETLVYRSLLYPLPLHVSRMAGILAQYKTEFAHLKGTKDPVLENKYGFSNGLEHIVGFNGFVLDFCNALWRQRILGAEESTVCFELPDEVLRKLWEKDEQLHRRLSITHSVAFAPFAHAYARRKAVAVADVRDDLKVEYLSFLANQGMEGLQRFLCCFVSSLVNRTK